MVVLPAVDVPVSAEAGAFPIETPTTMRALEARGVPPPVDGLKIEPVGYLQTTPRANHSRNVLGLRGRRGRWFQFRNRVQVLRRSLLLLRVRLRV